MNVSHPYRSEETAMKLADVVYLGGELSDRPELAKTHARHVMPAAKPPRKYSPAQKRRRQEKFEQWLERTGRLTCKN